MTPQDQRIMGMYDDDGMLTHQIAAAPGLTRKRVQTCVSLYTAQEPGQRHADYRDGTARLLAAIARHHPERVQGGLA